MTRVVDTSLNDATEEKLELLLPTIKLPEAGG
jgi:hypothetical protein